MWLVLAKVVGIGLVIGLTAVMSYHNELVINLLSDFLVGTGVLNPSIFDPTVISNSLPDLLLWWMHLLKIWDGLLIMLTAMLNRIIIFSII